MTNFFSTEVASSSSVSLRRKILLSWSAKLTAMILQARISISEGEKDVQGGGRLIK